MSNTPFDIPLRDELAATREELGLSQAGLADAVGVSRSTVSNWETHSVTPTPDNAGRLHEVLQRR